LIDEYPAGGNIRVKTTIETDETASWQLPTSMIVNYVYGVLMVNEH
jgi:hypothetical protein